MWSEEDLPLLKSEIIGKRNSVNKRTLSCMHVKVMDCWKIKRADNWTSLKVLKWYSFILWLALFVIFYEVLWILTPRWTVVLNCPGNLENLLPVHCMTLWALFQVKFVDRSMYYMISKEVVILSTILTCNWNSTMYALTQLVVLLGVNCLLAQLFYFVTFCFCVFRFFSLYCLQITSENVYYVETEKQTTHKKRND